MTDNVIDFTTFNSKRIAKETQERDGRALIYRDKLREMAKTNKFPDDEGPHAA